MKKRGILLFIISTLVFFILFISYSYAYTTSDYSIDIPPGFTKSGNSFTDDNGNSFNVNVTYVGNMDNFKYNKTNLNTIADALQEYGENFLITTIQDYVRTNYADYYYEIRDQLNLLDYSYDILDKDVVRFSDNNYKGFYIKTRLGIEDYYSYAEQYCVFSNDYQYLLTISSTDNSYFNSSDAKNIVNSFTVKNFNPVDTINIPFSKNLIIISLIVIIIVAVVLIIKLSDDKNKNNMNEHTVNVNYSKPKPPQNSKVKDAWVAIAIVFCIGTVGAIIIGNLYIILDVILTIFGYMIYPFCCLASGNRYNQKEAARIAIINSIVVEIIFTILRSLIADVNSISGFAAVVYGTINYNLLKTDEHTGNNNTKDD